MKKNLFSLMLIATIVTGMVAVLWAAVPPPPVNQSLGLYDTKFASFTITDCKNCHGTDPELVDLHHNLIESKGMACFDCHSLVSDGSGGFTLKDFRTCSVCHTSSPHHTSTAAVNKDCKHCHGYIDNPNDGHYIPTYGASLLTPKPHGTTLNNGTIVQGCAACHQAKTTANPIIYSNQDTHHGTGIGQPGGTGNCTWCHSTASTDLAKMRQCESCHGVKSLHNIQAPAGTSDPVPGSEPAGYGHIGNDWDCVGCHYSWAAASSLDSPATAIIPSITGQNTRVLVADTPNVITLNGVSFRNTGGNGVVYNPTINISNSTTSINVTPDSVTVSEIKAVIPALSKNIYTLRVMKGDVQSNPIKLVVVPEQVIKTAILSSNNTVTISGRGFGDAPPPDFKSALGVFINDNQVKVLSWSDEKIVASGSVIQAGATVKVQTLHGALSKTISAAATKTKTR